ncbi:MAG: hypothetical protein ACRD68_18160, partial [Pyrinomonadaceae bacterium]
VVGKLVAHGALMYVNIKGTANDLARMNTPKPPPPKKPPPSPHGEKLDGTPAENLKKLKDPNKKIDLTEDPTATGKTADGSHTTTVASNPPRARVGRASFDEKFPPDKAFWKNRVTNNDRMILLRHKFKGAPTDPSADMVFWGQISEDGIVRVNSIKTSNWRKPSGEIVTDPDIGAELEAKGLAEPVKSSFPDGSPALVAKDLYAMMFDHFEAAAARGGPKIKGIEGQFTGSNYQAWKEAVKAGTDPAAAILEKTKTGPLWKTELDGRGYTYKMIGSPKETPGSNMVEWAFEVTK